MSATFGQPDCAANAIDGATLEFTVTNRDTVNRIYDLKVGPHGHNGLFVAAGQSTTFTLMGIPNGQWTASVERQGTTLASQAGLIFNCNRNAPAVAMRYETGRNDGEGTRMQATWNGDGFYQVRWYYDMTAAEISAANFAGHTNQRFLSNPESSIVPDEAGTTRNLWCVAVRGRLSDATSTAWTTRCARSFKCNVHLVTVMIDRGEFPTGGADVILGTAAADTINAGSGDDWVCSLGGADQIDAGGGSDRVFAGGGNDVVNGHWGNDFLYGGAGSDRLMGFTGSDRLFGQADGDELIGGGGIDYLYGAAGDDTLIGEAGNDRLFGADGVDHAYGGDGNDNIYGGNGNDTLLGGYGTDFINGQGNTDICVSEETRNNCEARRTGAEHVIALIPHYNLFGVFNDAGRALNRERMEQPLLNLTVAESTEVMDYVRSQNKRWRFVNSMLDVGDGATRNEVVARWVEAINTKLVDFQIETLTYTEFVEVEGCFCFFADGRVSLDYSNTDIGRDVLMHETNHAFNHRHGLGGLSALNEGFSIAIGQQPGERNIAETVYGTVLFYRDIGIVGLPRDLPMGDTSQADAKLRDQVAVLMEGDISTINWNNSAEVDDIFNRFWVQLDRDVDFSTEWLPQAELATQQGIDFLGR